MPGLEIYCQIVFASRSLSLFELTTHDDDSIFVHFEEKINSALTSTESQFTMNSSEIHKL